jgi:hypothetical protein
MVAGLSFIREREGVIVMKSTACVAVLLSFLLATYSCQSGSSPLSPGSGEVVKASGLKLVASASGLGTGGLTFRIDLKNEGKSAVSVEFSDSQVFDLAVSNMAGDLVWKWSHDKAFLQVMWQLDLKPGDVCSRTADWDCKANDGSPLAPGIYRVKAWILSYSPDKDLSVEFSITI